MISPRILKNLEYDRLLELVSGFSSSSVAKKKILSITPYYNVYEIDKSLDRTLESYNVLYKYEQKPYLGLDDLTDTLVASKKNSVLTLAELLKIGRLLSTSRKLKEAIYSLNEDVVILKEDCMPLYDNLVLEKNISDWIINETDIADKASDKLYLVRKKIRQTNENIKTKMQHYVMSNQYQKYLQDSIVTVRNGRYVIPVKVEYKSSIPGLVHDQSTSGATVFIEPFPIVELNNELVTQYAEEKAEIERIISYLSAMVSDDAEKLERNVEIISDIDIAFAKAQYAHETFSIRPKINERGFLSIQNGRHPLIDAKKVVPVSVELGKNYSILLVTGANTGGKTVTLKMTGLLTLMAMSGMFIPAEVGSEIPVFESIFSDIGDEQSIQQSLSTFSAHITNIANILKNLSRNSLVLFDELGAGTDPTEGAALAISVTKELLDIGAKAVITTHYSELKAFSFSTNGIENASMEFDPATFAPTYKLNIGMPGASNALNIASRLGLSERVVSRARSYISEDKVSFEDVLLDAQSVRLRATREYEEANKMKSDVESELLQIKKLRAEIENEKNKLILTAEKKAKKIIEQYVEEGEEIIEKLKAERQKNDPSSFFEATKLNKRLKNLQIEKEEEQKEREFDDSEIRVGDLVFVDSLGGEGRVLSIKPNGKCVLKVGSMELNSTINSLKKVKEKKSQGRTKKISIAKPLNIDAVSTELKVIGQTSEECLYNLEYFLDKALMSGLSEVRIVHGVGAGILRRAIHEYLKGHRGVKSFRLGRYGEGDNGVTIVDLSK